MAGWQAYVNNFILNDRQPICNCIILDLVLYAHVGNRKFSFCYISRLSSDYGSSWINLWLYIRLISAAIKKYINTENVSPLKLDGVFVSLLSLLAKFSFEMTDFTIKLGELAFRFCCLFPVSSLLVIFSFIGTCSWYVNTGGKGKDSEGEGQLGEGDRNAVDGEGGGNSRE